MITHDEFVSLILEGYVEIEKSPISWYGGKYYMADEIIKFFDKHFLYVEPFFGAGHILFKKPKSSLEVVNDINETLMEFWTVIQDKEKFQEFLKEIVLLPPSPALIDKALKTSKYSKAIKIYVSSLFGFNGIEYKKFCLSKHKPIPDRIGRFLFAHRRLKDVVIENTDAIEVIKKYQSDETLFYLDPPYVHDTRVSKDDYEYEMSNSQHSELIDTVLSCKGIFVISNYDNEIYDKLLQYGYKKYKFYATCHASDKKCKPKRVEVLWTNSKIQKIF